MRTTTFAWKKIRKAIALLKEAESAMWDQQQMADPLCLFRLLMLLPLTANNACEAWLDAITTYEVMYEREEKIQKLKAQKKSGEK